MILTVCLYLLDVRKEIIAFYHHLHRRRHHYRWVEDIGTSCHVTCVPSVSAHVKFPVHVCDRESESRPRTVTACTFRAEISPLNTHKWQIPTT